MLKILHSLPGWQAVRCYILIFILPADIWTFSQVCCLPFFFFFSCNKKMALDSGLGRTFSGKDVCHGLSFPVVIDKSCCPRCSSVELMWVWAILVCRGDSRGFSPWLHLFLASPGPTGLLGITGAVICQRIQAEGQSLAPKPQRTH